MAIVDLWDYHYDSDPCFDGKYSSELDVLQYLVYDLECDKDGGYAHYYGCDVRDVKPRVVELLKTFNCEGSEILLRAFDDDFGNDLDDEGFSNEWTSFYDVVQRVFEVLYRTIHPECKE